MSVREIDDLRNTSKITAVGKGKRVKFRKADLDRIAERMPDRDTDRDT